MPYPTMFRIAPSQWQSEEERDGVPDFMVWRDEKTWGGIRVKTRTTGVESQRFNRVIDALTWIKRNFPAEIVRDSARTTRYNETIARKATSESGDAQ